MKKQLLRMTELLYPRKCPLCDGILGGKEPLLCRNCGKKLKFAEEPRCFRCGKPLVREEEEYCHDCRRNAHVFERCTGPFLYEGEYRQSILRFKYRGRQAYAGFYSAAIRQRCGAQIRSWKPEVLIPVPVHRERLLKRGYNQAEVLAVKLGQEMGIPVAAGAVIRRRNTAAQKLLDNRERKKNLERAFAPGKEGGAWKSVLIVDDIYTTGSTVDAVARVLKARGTARVYAVCVCIAPGET